MLLGKRQRHPMRRTTSMTGITVDVADVDSSSSSSGDRHGGQNPHAAVLGPGEVPPFTHHQHQNMNMGINEYEDEHHHQSLMAMVSPRLYSRSSNEFIEPAHFLRTCGLCKRRLAPGRDIYMYRGDTAFCSLECRERQMKQDEKKEKKLMCAGSTGSSKKDHKNHAPSPPATSSSSSTETRTMAAA